VQRTAAEVGCITHRLGTETESDVERRSWAQRSDANAEVGRRIRPQHGHAAWTWACSLDMGIQPGHGYGAYSRTWKCSMDIDIWLSGHHNIVCSTVQHVSRHFLFNFTVLPAYRPPKMTAPTFSFELMLSDNHQMLFLLQG
jgi:hypothetical protein